MLVDDINVAQIGLPGDVAVMPGRKRARRHTQFHRSARLRPLIWVGRRDAASHPDLRYASKPAEAPFRRQLAAASAFLCGPLVQAEMPGDKRLGAVVYE